MLKTSLFFSLYSACCLYVYHDSHTLYSAHNLPSSTKMKGAWSQHPAPVGAPEMCDNESKGDG